MRGGNIGGNERWAYQTEPQQVHGKWDVQIILRNMGKHNMAIWYVSEGKCDKKLKALVEVIMEDTRSHRIFYD